MIRRRLNPNSSDDNTLKLSSGLQHLGTDKWKSTRTITTLSAMIYLNAAGESVTKTWSPAKDTWATIKAALETEVGVGGYYIGNEDDYGIKVVPDGSDFIVTFTGDIKVTSLSGSATTVTALGNDNQASPGF
jgi:hypothetical protein